MRSMVCGIVLGCLLPLAAVAAPEGVAGTLVAPAQWQQHVRDHLLPWWQQAEALGQPPGRFPTFRCNDGRAWQPEQPCAELEQAPAWIRSELGRDYVRMQSRQVFAYAVGFHLTGDVQLLRWAQAGAADIRQRALDPETGSPASWYEQGQAGPPTGERTAQDVAYAGLSLAVLYYLTADPAVLADLDRLHQHLMRYYDPVSGQLRWTLTGPGRERQELVAQLDPLNAYMILVTPLLRGDMQRRWQADMRRLVQAIRTQYCPGTTARCAGTLGLSESWRPGGRHNDFGHSGKAFWMLLLAGRQLNDSELQAWASQRARALLQAAWIEDAGAWASRWKDQGVERGNAWWSWAELDQLAGTLALTDASYSRYLQYSWPFWLTHYVDGRAGEVWGWVGADGMTRGGVKQHHWKNGYHSFEHALIGYLVSSALHGQAATLYFADSAAAHPHLPSYMLPGRERSRQPRTDGVLQVQFDLPAAAAGEAVAPLPQPLPLLTVRGQRYGLQPDALFLLVGRWQGEWESTDGSQRGPCHWHIRALDREQIDALTCRIGAAGDAAATLPLQTRISLSDGALLLPGPQAERPLRLQWSIAEDQNWLQWLQPLPGGGHAVVRLRRTEAGPASQ